MGVFLRQLIILSIFEDVQPKSVVVDHASCLLFPDERIDSLRNINFLAQQNMPELGCINLSSLVFKDGRVQAFISLIAERSILVRN